MKTKDRLEELHELICSGTDFQTLSPEDQKLLVDDADAAIAECERESRDEAYARHLERCSSRIS